MRALSAGRRDRQITFERATVADDDYGGGSETWAAFATEWAQVSFGTGVERRTAAQEAASAPATFRVLANGRTSDVTTRDRIMFDGSAWDIVSNVPLGREGREITAVRRTA
ncbi:MAG TPA: head-tail adaptor protein [Sphingomicrobium sp.]|nr:head-tail adaptor protein [Sphingomicrobium sp.]